MCEIRLVPCPVLYVNYTWTFAVKTIELNKHFNYLKIYVYGHSKKWECL